MRSEYPRPTIEAIAGALKLPSGVAIRAWQESDFPAVQRLSTAEGWTTPIERPEEARNAWRHSWPALVAVLADEVIGFSRALSDEAVTTYIAELRLNRGPVEEIQGATLRWIGRKDGCFDCTLEK